MYQCFARVKKTYFSVYNIFKFFNTYEVLFKKKNLKILMKL